MVLSRTEWTRAFAAALSFAALLWGFRAMFLWHAPSMFSAPEEDLGYGWYVPVFSLYLVWRMRGALRSAAGSPSWAGAAACVPFVLLGFLGVRGVQLRFEIVAFAGLCVTVPWALYGRRVAGKLLFPAAFLLFCIPLNSFLDVVTIHLRLMATGAAYWVLKGLGAAVVRTGTMMHAADGSFSIDVANPCSGLRSLFAMMALAAGYAYLSQPGFWRKAALFALSVPIAILGNVVRIFTIVLVAATCSAGFATGFYHDYSGYVVFAMGILLLLAADALLNRLFGSRRDDGGEAAQPKPRSRAPSNAGAALCAVFCAALGVAMAEMSSTPEAEYPPAPAGVLGEVEGFSWIRVEPSEAELETLPRDTRFDKRVYSSPGGRSFAVNAVFGGRSKSSIHRPELCLPSQGVQMAAPRTIEAAGVSWRMLFLEKGRNGRGCFAYTFMNQAGFRTSSHVVRIMKDVVDRSLLNRIDRWVMVTVSSTDCDERAFKAFLAGLVEGGGL